MPLFFEIQSGPLKGRKYKIEPDLVIGRREGTILLETDGKVSGQHGKVELDNKGRPCLVDLGSSNGFVINENRVRRVALLPGVTFRVGETLFQVQEISEFEAAALAPVRTWREQLRDLLTMEPGANPEEKTPLMVFTPVVRLEFIEGPQAEQIVTLAYGPRVAGLGHIDIDLADPNAPDEAFEITAGAGVAILKDLSRGKVQVNSQPTQEGHMLREGDLISIGLSVIRVGYV